MRTYRDQRKLQERVDPRRLQLRAFTIQVCVCVCVSVRFENCSRYLKSWFETIESKHETCILRGRWRDFVGQLFERKNASNVGSLTP